MALVIEVRVSILAAGDDDKIAVLNCEMSSLYERDLAWPGLKWSESYIGFRRRLMTCLTSGLEQLRK